MLCLRWDWNYRALNILGRAESIAGGGRGLRVLCSGRPQRPPHVAGSRAAASLGHQLRSAMHGDEREHRDRTSKLVFTQRLLCAYQFIINGWLHTTVQTMDTLVHTLSNPDNY